jgi:hypothetical protein
MVMYRSRKSAKSSCRRRSRTGKVRHDSVVAVKFRHDDGASGPRARTRHRCEVLSLTFALIVILDYERVNDGGMPVAVRGVDPDALGNLYQ